MKKGRSGRFAAALLLAAALVAGSMAAYAGAADTADRDALLETAVTHLQQQWQTGNTSAYDKTADYYASIYSLMPEKNLYELFFSIDVSRHNHGIINMQTGKVIVPPEYDTVERLENDTFLLTKSGQEPNTLDCWFSDTEGNCILHFIDNIKEFTDTGRFYLYNSF